MRLLYMGVASGLREILAHKLRSFLTLFGIVLGTASLVCMMGVVKGMLRSFETMIYETGGIERISVLSRPPPENQRENAMLSPGRTMNDVDAILRAVPLAQRVTAEVTIPGGARLYYQGRATGQIVRGVLPATFVMDRFEIAQGRLIGELDLELQTQVVVLGPTIAEYLFPRGIDALDRVITINAQPFTVVGVLQETQGASGGMGGRFSSKNSAVFIPLTTTQTLFRLDENVDVLNVQLADIDDMPYALEQISNVLTHTHRGIQDVRLETREDLLQSFEKQRNNYYVSLGSIAIIGLIVGGIGIMNVILASINERIREIGVRRALGAKRTDILVQILAESLTLAVSGGVLGMVASVALIKMQQAWSSAANRPELSVFALAVGVLSSGVIGVVAGIYPAIRASRLSPVEALRSD